MARLDTTRRSSWTPSGLVAATLLAIAWALVGGCGFGQAKKDADKVITRHFQTIATNGYDLALADYGAPFFQKMKKEDWSKMLARMTTRLGIYQSHTITGWRVFKKAGTFGAGTTVYLQCQVVYSKHPALESFTLYKAATDSDYKIIGHQIDGAALLQE